ncbi:MAG: YbaK/EbsC family protein [Actinomycetota bacterium]
MSDPGIPHSDPKVLRVVEAGRSRGIQVRPISFAGHTRTAADAARQVGCEVGQIVKSLVFMAGDRPVLLLVSGANRVDLGKAASALGLGDLDKADADSARAASGFSIGATPPFGHATEIPVLMDADLLTHDQVWAAAGRPDTVFPLSPEDLRRATDAPTAELKQE